MKLNYYYFKEQEKCFLCNYDEKPEYDTICKDPNVISIDMKNKNVQNLYDFFRQNTLRILANGSHEEFEINDFEIAKEHFYATEPFKKLMDLINQSIEKCNETIKVCNQTNQQE